MRFLTLSLGFNADGPQKVSSKARLDGIVAQALWAEDAGIDAFAVGEHHTPDTEVSSPPVLLAAIAARTRRIRLFTAVTVLSVLDPVRVYEDYATVDNLSDGRVELIIGKGNTALQQEVFGYHEDDQWDRIEEKYDLLRLLIDNESVTWSGKYRPPLNDFSVRPRFLQQRPPIWHGSATSTRSTELAARHGDPLFSANVTGRLEQYRTLVEDHRRRWADHGRDPSAAVVGAGSAAVHLAPTSQQARAEFEPNFAERQRRVFSFAQQSPFVDFADAIAHGSWFVGSPAQVTESILRHQEVLGHSVQHIGEVDRVDPVRRAGAELFVDQVIPQVRNRLSGSAGTGSLDDDILGSGSVDEPHLVATAARRQENDQ
ncbi:LLM class flavin-dependent oxidoreductase [Naumannella halotolerans]|uniref:LLM class flavin-dependent oxidoreductase n=1 Tax=Naumannella halotolerans TaxID=993414 RepID=UPI00370D4FCE